MASLKADNRRAYDHVGNYNFRIEIEGITWGSFKNVEGLAAEAQVIEEQNGDERVQRKRPGQMKYSNITLKRGYVSTPYLWEWWKAVREGKVQRKSGSIILQNDHGLEVMRYNFFEAWPCKWKGFTLDGKGTDSAVEEIEMVVERWERIQGAG
ncbi:phage tail protein [Myxococcota bacterium]|nr:phage tail protein [Myxococcota bacterium]MBU1899550.1 phage tail protein [Myxococcota bacterium]